jgi:bacterioferritin
MKTTLRPQCPGHPENTSQVILKTGKIYLPAVRFPATGIFGPEGTMKGDKDIIKHLNKVLRNELTAINQYFLHARMLQDQGLERLGKHEYQESVEEMHHADWMVKRILFLEGLPNLQDLGKLMIGENVAEILANDLKLEYAARNDVVDAIVACEKGRDFISREKLKAILDATEEHIDYLETQISLLESVGIQNYIQSQMAPLDGEEY